MSAYRNFVWQLRKISNDAGMPFRSDPFFNRYVNGVDNVEPLFRQLKQDRMDLQLIMIVLPGKTPVYGQCRLYMCVCSTCRSGITAISCTNWQSGKDYLQHGKRCKRPRSHTYTVNYIL